MRKTKFNLQVIIAFFTILALIFPSATPSVFAQSIPQPETVTIAGTMQSELGCDGDWMPSCAITNLTFDANSGIWKGTFEVTPGNDQDKKGPRYKVALNGTWDENYGMNAKQGGADIPLVVDQPTMVTFYYDHKTHVITDDYNTPIIVAIGDFQTQLGCQQNNDPACLRAWLQDPEGDGSFTFSTSALKADTYSVALAISQKNTTTTTDPTSFTVAKDNDEIFFGYDLAKKEFTISTTGAPKGSLSVQKAIWVNQDTILWDVIGSSRYQYALVYSPEAALELTADSVLGGIEVPLTYTESGPGDEVLKQNPHLKGYSAFKLAEADLDEVPQMLRGQLAVVARYTSGKMVDATGVQIAGVLDDLYTYSGKLGVEFVEGTPTLECGRQLLFQSEFGSMTTPCSQPGSSTKWAR